MFKYLCLILFIVSTALHGQELDAFEESFKEEESDDNGRSSNSRESKNREDRESILGLVLYMFVMAGSYSYARVNGDPYTTQREIGEPLLVIARSDTSFYYINPELWAVDERLEFGYGAFGVSGRYTMYFETDNTSKLHLFEGHLHYRMSLGDGFEIAPGVGGFFMKGNSSYDGLSLSCPMKVNIRGVFSIEYIPTWNSYPNESWGRDNDVSLIIDCWQVKPKIGFRQYMSSGGESLNAWYLGVAVVY